MKIRDYSEQHVNLHEVLVVTGQVIAGKEDYVYQEPEGTGTGCVYSYNGEPSCIVGRILAKLKIELPPENNSGQNGAVFVMIPQREFFTMKAKSFLMSLQGYQDQHYAWGTAVDMALNQVEKCDVS